MRTRDKIRGLKRLRRLLEKPGAWTRLASARRADGASTYALDELAVCWCLSGGTYVVEPEFAGFDLDVALKAALPRGCGIVEFNDRQKTVKPVLRLIDKAIAKLEAP